MIRGKGNCALVTDMTSLFHYVCLLVDCHSLGILEFCALEFQQHNINTISNSDEGLIP